ncbi:MAG: hypothetical protein IT545_15515 [Rhodobacteraceae bacterium]|nr:hypothetical protein [Paracoccaceae bacterium]
MGKASGLAFALLAGAMALTLAMPAPAEENEGRLRRPGAEREGAEAAVRGFFAAEVRADGTLASGAGAISASRVDLGKYEVFVRKSNLHVRCWWTGSIAERIVWSAPYGGISFDARAGTNNGLWVQTYDMAGALADMPFIVVAVCR